MNNNKEKEMINIHRRVNIFNKLLMMNIIAIFYGCSSTQIIKPVLVYERNEIEYSDLKTIELKVEKIFGFYFKYSKRIDGMEFRKFLGNSIDAAQIMNSEYPNYDTIIHPNIVINEEIVIPKIYSKINLRITARMANYKEKDS